MSDISIRIMATEDIPAITDAFAALRWERPIERYLAEQSQGAREVLLAWQGGEFAGYVTIVWHSEYAPFRDAGIPEISDFSVPQSLRRQGIGSRLLDEAERRIAERSPLAGIGVGLSADYGAAQRLYVQRGYIPDSRGAIFHGRQVAWGATVVVDDEMALFFTKRLRP
jgi:GNAT superfamily N-acetyltransferase